MLQPPSDRRPPAPPALLSRLARFGASAALAFGAAAGAVTSFGSPAAAQSSVRRPTVPVIPVARVTPRGAEAARGGVKPGAKAPAKPAAKPAVSGAKPAAKPVAARGSAALPVAARDTDATVVDPSVTSAASGGEVTRSSGYTRYRSARDSAAGASARAAVERARGLRVAVSLESRELAVLDGADTLLVAPVAIGMDTTLRYGSRTWTFDTPRGKRTVRRKDENPVWVPPDWHYAEVANRKGLKLAYLPAKGGVSLGGGRRLLVRGGMAGVLEDGEFTPLPTDEEIVFGKTLYVPPLGSKNRQIEGELGRFRLDLGDGYQLHGTPHEDTIGDAATHGCIRLYDEDVEWLYQHVPLGTPVYIF